MGHRVTVYTQAYNTEQYLAQCVESVLNQTFADFEYIIVDNACTDGSTAMLREYAARDGRIRLIRYEENRRGFWWKLVRELATGEYVAVLDSDDWWEPDYLERLVALAEETGADMVCTGAMMHSESTGTCTSRKTDRRWNIEPQQYAGTFPLYHVFLRTTWGKLTRMSVLRSADIPDFSTQGLIYGGDTLTSFAMLRRARRLVLDASALYHYRVRGGSTSYRYDPRRFDSDVWLYRDAVDFLSAYGPLNGNNRLFLAMVYANAVKDTVSVIHRSTLPAAEKLRHYRTIAEHPVTAENFAVLPPERNPGRTNLINGALVACLTEKTEDFDAVVTALSPRCAAAVGAAQAELLRGKPQLADALLRDEPEEMVRTLLDMLSAGELSKQFDLYAMICALSPHAPLLRELPKKLLRRYGNICLLLWQGRDAEALEAIDALLPEGKKGDRELAALRERLSARD